MKDFHKFGTLTKACTTSFITFILKNLNIQSLYEYKPICLIGSLHKIQSKVLAARLKLVIGSLVLENQSTFIPGRYIADGVLLINEIMDMAKRENRGCMNFKVDFEKAYDLVSWNFLRYIMKRMGFGDKWRRWMEASIFSSTMSLIVNGSTTKDFFVERV